MMARRSGALAALRASPALARLAVAQTVSPLGDAMTTVALILHLQRIGGTGTTVATLLFAEAIPPLLAPLLGTVVDRSSNTRRLLVVCFAGQAVVVGGMAAWLPGLAPLAALMFVRGALATVAGTVVGAATPAIVADEDLPAANAVLTAARELGSVVGPPLAGLLFAWAGARAALTVDVATFVIALPFVLGLPARVVETSTGWSADVMEGLRYMMREPLVRAVAIGFWIAVLATVSDDLVLPFLGRDVLHASPVGIGVLMAAASVGLVLGLPLVPWSARSLTMRTAIVAGFLVVAIGNSLTAVAPVIAAAFLAQLLRGMGIPLIESSVRTALQRTVPTRMLGRTMANVYGGVGVAAALGYVIGGPLLDATSPRVMFAIIGAGGLVAVVVCAALLRQVRPPAVAGVDAAP